MICRSTPLALAALLVLAACGNERIAAPAETDTPVPLEAAHVIDGRLTDEFEAVGHVCQAYDDLDPWRENPLYVVVGEWVCLPAGAVLVSPTVALGVTHGRFFRAQTKPTKAAITFDPDYASGAPKIEMTIIDNPAWDPAFPAVGDVAVMQLHEPVTHITPARLPRWIGEVDRIVKPGETRATLVGYGILTPDGFPDQPAWGLKRIGRTRIAEVNPGYVLATKSAPGEVTGCFGDSGSSMFRGAGRTGVVWGFGANFIGPNCSWMGYSRLDTKEVREFLSPYLPAHLLPRGN